VSCHTRRPCLSKMSLESRFMGQFPILSITWSIPGSRCCRTKSYYWSPTWSFTLQNSFPFYENEQTLVALLPSVDIYIPTVYTSPPTPRYSRFPPFFPLDYGGPWSGGSNIKKGFLDCEFWRFPKNSNSLTPNKYCISTNHTSIKNIPQLLAI